MGERTARLDATSNHAGVSEAPHASTREATRQLEGEIASLREELGGLVAELDRRRHELVDVKLQFKRHAGGAALFGLALVATATGFVWMGMWRARRREQLLSRAGRLREAVARMVDRPERVAAEPSVPAKILTAAATAAVATLVKKGLERMARAILDGSGTRRPLPPPALPAAAASSVNAPPRTDGALTEQARTGAADKPHLMPPSRTPGDAHPADSKTASSVLGLRRVPSGSSRLLTR